MDFQIGHNKPTPKVENKGLRNTIVSSVSISKEFDEIIKRNNLSPTDIFRKGFIIEACEQNIIIPGIDLSSDLIQKRLKKYEEISTLLKFDELEKDLLHMENQIQIFRNKLININVEAK